MGNTLFNDDDELVVAWFLIVLALLALVGLAGGAWGGALTAKCWDDEEEKKSGPGSEDIDA